MEAASNDVCLKSKLDASVNQKTFVSFDVKLVRSLYASYIRPLVEFSVPIWCPDLKGDINSLEKVQHRVTRLVPGFRKLAYAERFKRLGITALEQRRKRGDLEICMKNICISQRDGCIHCHCSINFQHAKS